KRPLVEVALRREANALATRILPVTRILARVRAARAQSEVGALGTATRARAVAAHENDDRRRLRAIAVPAQVQRPSREKVVVALELPSRCGVHNAVIELDDHVELLLAVRELDDQLRAKLTSGARRGITAAAGEQSPARAQRVATGGTDGVAHRHSPAVATMELEAIDEPCVG